MILRTLSVVLLLLVASPLLAGGTEYTVRFSPGVGAVGGQADVTLILDIEAGALDVAAWSLGVCHGPEVDIASVVNGGTTNNLDPDFIDQQITPGDGWAVGVVISFVGSVTLPPGTGYALHVARYDLLEEGDAAIQFCDSIGSPPVATVVSDTTSATVPPVQQDGTIIIGLIPPFTLSCGSSVAGPGEAVSLPVTVDNPVEFDGFAIGLGHPAGELTIDQIDPGAALTALNGGLGPDYFAVNLAPEGDPGATVACLASLFGPFETIPVDAANELVVVGATVGAGLPDGTFIPVAFTDALGVPPVFTRVTVAGASVTPLRTDGQVEVSGTPVGTEFLRGDVSGDGAIAINDGVTLASYLFSGGTTPGCLDAGDWNDSGDILIDDVVSLLSFLFSSGGAPQAPYPTCGPDPSAGDPLDCAVAPTCP